MRCSHVRTIAVAAATAALAAPAAAASAQAASSQPPVTVLSSKFVLPLQFAVSHHKIYVADAATSTVSLVNRMKPVVTGPQPGEIAGVDLDRSGATLAYTSTDAKTGSTALTILGKGRPVTADLSGFEKAKNPDRGIHYGVKHPSTCVTNALKAAHVPVGYRGIIESHPYSVASLGQGSWAVADAAGNDLLKVDRKGHVSLLTVLPSQPLTVTAAMAASLQLPRCVVGVTYAFEPVPTDVEVGPDGKLYVSTLPGGPEGPQLGARGSVYKVDPTTGRWQRVATGFLGATNVALDRQGTIYVAELFAGRISTVWHGGAKPFVTLPGVAGVEYADGHLYGSTVAPTDDQGNPTGKGTIVRIGS
jgi:hypothetical protein